MSFEAQNEENHLTKLLRMDVIKWACRSGLEDCITNSMKHFENTYFEINR